MFPEDILSKEKTMTSKDLYDIIRKTFLDNLYKTAFDSSNFGESFRFKDGTIVTLNLKTISRNDAISLKQTLRMKIDRVIINPMISCAVLHRIGDKCDYGISYKYDTTYYLTPNQIKLLKRSN